MNEAGLNFQDPKDPTARIAVPCTEYLIWMKTDAYDVRSMERIMTEIDGETQAPGDELPEGLQY
jgi:hypothetical protein